MSMAGVLSQIAWFQQSRFTSVVVRVRIVEVVHRKASIVKVSFPILQVMPPFSYLLGSFVVFYEEPTLRKKFGAEYEEYCRNVRRWRPRVRGWDARRLS
jgi:protein-S-isoprenylcysteine O-methyltransferase Ste14